MLGCSFNNLSYVDVHLLHSCMLSCARLTLEWHQPMYAPHFKAIFHKHNNSLSPGDAFINSSGASYDWNESVTIRAVLRLAQMRSEIT